MRNWNRKTLDALVWGGGGRFLRVAHLFLKTGKEAKVLVSISTCFSILALHSPEQVQSPLITVVKKERLAISTIERKMTDGGGGGVRGGEHT